MKFGGKNIYVLHKKVVAKWVGSDMIYGCVCHNFCGEGEGQVSATSSAKKKHIQFNNILKSKPQAS